MIRMIVVVCHVHVIVAITQHTNCLVHVNCACTKRLFTVIIPMLTQLVCATALNQLDDIQYTHHCAMLFNVQDMRFNKVKYVRYVMLGAHHLHRITISVNISQITKIITIGRSSLIKTYNVLPLVSNQKKVKFRLLYYHYHRECNCNNLNLMKYRVNTPNV